MNMQQTRAAADLARAHVYVYVCVCVCMCVAIIQLYALSICSTMQSLRTQDVLASLGNKNSSCKVAAIVNINL